MERVELIQLLEAMTLREKLAQLTQITGEPYIGRVDDEMVETGPAYPDNVLRHETLYAIGSVIGVSSARIANLVQQAYLERSRLQIPLLFMHDAIHGYKTIFPIPLALSCTWDDELVRQVAEATASELRAAGIHVNFSPMVDLVRDARWGRVMESFGEDHLLSGRLGRAMIKGYQKRDEDGTGIGPEGVAACLKHFAAYGAAIGGKDYNAADMSMREFYAFYGKTYEIALQENPTFVMSSFNTFNGIPVTADEHLLKDILRDRYGFENLLISDWGAISELQNHRVAADGKDAAELALQAGVDIEMISTTYLAHGEEIVSASPALLQQVNEAVLKVLELKNELGLFEQPYADEATEGKVILQPAFHEAAREAARRSCVLLKNDNGTLPIPPAHRSVLVVGPFGDTRELLGNWACKGSFSDVVTLAEGIRLADPSLQVRAVNRLEDCPAEFLTSCDYIVATIGEPWQLSGEGHSSVHIGLEESQRQLVRAVKETGKPYACVAFSGRPLALQDVVDDIPALLWCWYPGTQAGLAVADLLTGKETPSGKLTMSFPRYSAQTPIHYNEYSSGRPAKDSSYSNRYQDCEIGPLFPFGHGLTYAGAQYSNFRLSDSRITEDGSVKLTFDIYNPSGYSYAEIVILYIEDLVSRAVRPLREMKQYRLVQLPPYGTVRTEMTLTFNELKYLDARLQETIEPGEFQLYVNDTIHPVGTIVYDG